MGKCEDSAREKQAAFLHISTPARHTSAGVRKCPTKRSGGPTAPYALIFGIGQMLALIPGVSRSGGTITFGRAMGYTREAAVRVSFLMAIPAVFGAGILEAVSAVKDVAAGNAGMFPGWGATIAATIVAFVVGYVVIIGFLKFVSTFSYKAFAIYRIALAVVVALLLICGVLHPTEVVAAA